MGVMELNFRKQNKPMRKSGKKLKERGLFNPIKTNTFFKEDEEE